MSVVPRPISRTPNGTPGRQRRPDLSASSKPPSTCATPVSAITTPRIASRNVVPTSATSTTAPVTIPIAPAASGSRRRGPSAARPHCKLTIPLRIQYTPMKFTSAAGARSPFNASASPRTIAITPRVAVIHTSAIGPGVRTERWRLWPSDRRVLPARRLTALLRAVGRPRPATSGLAADCRHRGRRRVSASPLLQSGTRFGGGDPAVRV